MNAQQIEYILEVYQTGSMSKAAAKLYVSQPNLSNSIKALEYELGFPVFKRTKYGVTPTENGMMVLKHARRIWDSWQNMQQINCSVSRRRIHISGVFFSPVYRAFERLCLFYQEETDMDIAFGYVETVDPDAFLLSDFDIQTALFVPRTVKAFAEKAAARGILVTELKQVPIVLRIGPNHPLYHNPNVTPQELSCYPFVDYSGGVYQDYPELGRFLSIDRRRIIMVSDRVTKHNLVSKGAFISLGCKLPADMDEHYGFRNIALGDMSYTLVLLERKDQRRSPDVQKYIQLLMEELEKI